MKTDEQLKKIFHAFACRVSLGDLQRLAELDKAGWYAQANLGMNAQINAQNEFEDACYAAIDKMTDCDKRIINQAIEH